MTAKKCSIKIYKEFKNSKIDLPTYAQVNIIDTYTHTPY